METSPVVPPSDFDSVTPMPDELLSTIREIGLARFVGRINSGLIPASQGFEAVERFVSLERDHRPLLSRICQIVLHKRDLFEADTAY